MYVPSHAVGHHIGLRRGSVLLGPEIFYKHLDPGQHKVRIELKSECACCWRILLDNESRVLRVAVLLSLHARYTQTVFSASDVEPSIVNNRCKVVPITGISPQSMDQHNRRPENVQGGIQRLVNYRS